MRSKQGACLQPLLLPLHNKVQQQQQLQQPCYSLCLPRICLRMVLLLLLLLSKPPDLPLS
jgi:hypothetical protein